MSNEEAIAKTKAVSKGYEDGLQLCTERPLADYIYYIGFVPEYVTRGSIEPTLQEYYQMGFVAAWRKKHNMPSTDEFIKDMNGPSSEEQAYMRDLEQS